MPWLPESAKKQEIVTVYTNFNSKNGNENQNFFYIKM